MTTQLPPRPDLSGDAPTSPTRSSTQEGAPGDAAGSTYFSAPPGGTTEIPATLPEAAVALVRRWLTEASEVPVDASAGQLAGVLKDPDGLAFTVGFVDGVIRPEDLSVAARNLRSIAPKVPGFLPWYMRSAVTVGAAVAPVLPQVVIPIARRVLREMVGHLIIDASDAKLGRSIGRIRREGTRLNVNLLGEAVLGEREADRRLEGTRRLLARPDVDYVSIKVSSTVAPHPGWAFDEAVDHVVGKLTPLYALAARPESVTFINLDMEEYKDLDLTIAVFMAILDRPEFIDLEAGIVLQAYLPDSLAAMIRLQEWAAARRARGGAPIKVRVVKGANLPMEQVEASLHGWPLATWSSKQESDTHYKRVLNYALQPGRVDNVRIGVAGHNLFDLAFAWLLAGERGVRHGIEFEMLLGMAQGQAEAVKRDVGSLLLYTPVVHPREFDVAIAYLIRRLEEGASQDNFMSAVFELSENETLFEREKQRFLASLEHLDTRIPAPNRQQDRSGATPSGPVGEAFGDSGSDSGSESAGDSVSDASTGRSRSGTPTGTGFVNAADTDPSLPSNRAWGRGILERARRSTLGEATVAANTLTRAEDLEATIAGACAAATGWGSLSGAERAVILHRAGTTLEAHRADLVEVMASETGKTLDQADPEISEAVDFAHYYAERARELDDVDGASFTPVGLTVVTPPWNFPVAIPAGSTLAALAAGSAVIIKPAPQAPRSGSVMVEALWAAGVPRDVLRLVHVEEGDLGRKLLSDPRVDRVILTGGYETAELFRSFRADLPLLAETSGKNAVIVTPSADLDLAARDVAQSAFGHAGQKCSAASLVILVGSADGSERFRHQLVDAVTSLTVGYPFDPSTQMGPIIEPAAGKLLDGLTILGEGESWLVEPRQLDASGRLWSPGVRDGVRRGSTYHLTEYFGPILGIMTAPTLEDAIALQNDIDYGLTSGIHSLDSREIAAWIDGVQAGNLYVNRGITGAIVQRQPFGGWKRSAIGAGTKAGGPNYLVGLGSWTSRPSTAQVEPLPAVVPLLAAAREAGLAADDLDRLQRAAASDAAVWADEFGRVKDVSGLSAERNLFRYLPHAVAVRLAEGAAPTDLVRVVLAATAAGAPVTISSGVDLPAALGSALAARAEGLVIEDDAAWLGRATSLTDDRVRLIGAEAARLTADLATATGGRPDLAIHAQPVTEAGRVELLPFLREQAISITAHRFGTPNGLTDELLATDV